MKCFIERSARSGRGKIVNVTKDGLNDAQTFVLNSSIWDVNSQCKPSFFAVVNVGFNYHTLDSLVKYADTLQENDYTPASWLYFQSLLSSAKNAKDKNYSASVSAVDGLAQGITALDNALASLVRKDANIAFFLASKNSISFGGVAIGSVKKDSVKITNLGTDTLQIGSITSTNSQYSVSRGSAAIAPSGEIYLMISFTPSDTASQSGQIVLAYNAAGSPDSIAMSGKGNVAATVQDEQSVPTRFVLEQNYPNPFNPTTVIRYEVPVTTVLSLKVYNLLGQEVTSLFNGVRSPGRYIATLDGNNLTSGIYFYTLQTGTNTLTKKMLFLK